MAAGDHILSLVDRQDRLEELERLVSAIAGDLAEALARLDEIGRRMDELEGSVGG